MSRFNILALAILTVLLSGCLKLMPVLAPSAKDVESPISADFPFESRHVEVLDSQMHYVDEGEGPAVILLHGNPTSSYLWRNVIPVLARENRVIAVDLIGMGKSGKPDIAYHFEDHAAYFSAFVDSLGLADVALVLHDWGGGVGLDYAARNGDNVRGITFMEAVIRPFTWDALTVTERYLFRRLRDPDEGYRLISEDNFFVETILPVMSGRDLTEPEMDAYRSPYPTVESRKPVFRWPAEVPFDGVPQRNHERIGTNYEWLRASNIPVLLLHADPGAIVKPEMVKELKGDLPRMESSSIGSGLHYVQESQPTLIGAKVAEWLRRLEQQ